ncbi:hypothetical protein MTR_3g068230 [Medicago truncatula]|uniref:Uncharacterized protein n=1 Tax=Medicago truncatula TaxID=3880 RepID=A0A072UZ91_MEDTR|nr:hypothetical protein MTR_3g068230 [Medicago truncatula]
MDQEVHEYYVILILGWNPFTVNPPSDKGKPPKAKLHELLRCVQEEFETTFHPCTACCEAAVTIENN